MIGAFTAEATCSATPSIREPDNPGDIATEAGRTYELIGRNAVPGSHYLIVVPGAEPDRRWVAYGCGRVEDGGDTGSAQASTRDVPRDEYVLAVSWQPAFCETRPRVTECRQGGRDDAGFSLHGLWPQPRGREYCDVEAWIVSIDEDGDWLDLPEVELSGETRRALDIAMPGAASGLDQHEWWAHGSCFSGDADDYFAVSIRLLDELNDSAVRDLFEDAVGSALSADEIRAGFDAAFGRGAGKRVLVDCAEISGVTLVQELRIGIAGAPGDGLSDMILAGETTPRGCPGGEVDAAGLQHG